MPSEMLGEASRLLKETGIVITKHNHVLYEFEEWEAIDTEVAALEAKFRQLRELQAELEPRALRLEPDVVMYKATPNLVPHAEALEKFLSIMRSA